MKKTLLSTAALLLCLLAHSQEAELGNSYAELTIIPRLDLNPTYSDGDGFEFNHGNSSIYTLFEGSASEHFSWTVANHWISAGGDYGWPYTGLGYSDTTNWIDFLKADLTFGNWTFTLGKDVMSLGGFEYEDWDWDAHPTFNSGLWNDLSPYQWGGKVAYTTNSEMSTFSAQMTTSPFGERPFSSGLYTYSAQWRGEYGWFSNIWSVSALGRDKGVYDWIVSLGNRATFDSWTVTLDWENSAGYDEIEESYQSGWNLQGSVKYAPSEKWDATLKGNLTRWNGYDASMSSFGAIFQYYPLDDDRLRIHAYAAYMPDIKLFTLSVGARFNLLLNLW